MKITASPAGARAPVRRVSFRRLLGIVLLLGTSAGVAIWRWSRVPSELPDPRRSERLARLEALQKKEKELLGSYGWVDRSKGIVRVPLDRAMELELQELSRKPVRPSEEVVPTIRALESSSGTR